MSVAYLSNDFLRQLFRALYTLVKALPAFELHRKLKRRKGHPELKIGCRISAPEWDDSQSSDAGPSEETAHEIGLGECRILRSLQARRLKPSGRSFRRIARRGHKVFNGARFWPRANCNSRRVGDARSCIGITADSGQIGRYISDANTEAKHSST